ncbi:MAG: molecular chaperone HtpG [Coriobacteriales bacterium]|nr:molecular chaperone HtpG [Coriobacteriales bacterium]
MKEFRTESKKLLDLMANSIYTNRDIFLRELVSNASDAIDKLSFMSLTNTDAKLEDEDLEIRISFDKDERSITVSDNGIGMNEEEMERNLGTIAHSGSEEFKQANEQAQGSEVDIIGQFGVGFYSSFMVSKRVRVVSRAFGSDDTYVWESDGAEGYTLELADEQRPTHGTDVICFLRDEPEAATGEDDEPETGYDHYLSEWGLRDLVTRYSNYVRHPIRMMVTKSRELPKPEDADDDYTPEYEDYEELETLNSMTPIWRKRKQDVEQSDYDEFYKSTFHDWDEPARTIPFHVEGTLDYYALLFVPGRAPFDLYSKDYEKGLALYSSNVLIMEKCADLLPDYYNFVRGVVDSPDVSLNISRETLQQNRQLRVMARSIERQITRNLQDMRDNDREAYEKFFENFGRGLKFGIYNSYGSKADPLANLLLFWSARENRMVTLAEYVAAMPDGQEVIYYVSGDSRDRLSKMPIVKTVVDKGFDVLLCTQDVDEFCFQAMHNYHADAIAGDSENKGKDARDLELKNVTSGDLDLASDEEKEAAEKATSEHEALFTALAGKLEDKVEKVVAAASVTEAPARITTEGPVSLEMERVLAQGPEGMEAPKSRRVLELNASHPVFEKLVAAQESGDEDKLALYASLLYDQALLVEGLAVDDPVAFAKNVCSLM